MAKDRRALSTWAGRGQFQYEGSVEQGVRIFFGEGFRYCYRIDRNVFTSILGAFSGQEVSIGTSRTDPPKGSLGRWMMENCTKMALTSYIGPILIEEGLARRGSQSDRIMIK